MRSVGYVGALFILSLGCGEQDDREWVGQRIVHVSEASTNIELCGRQMEFADRLAATTSQRWHAGENDRAGDERFVIDLRLFDENEGVGAARAGGLAWVAKQLAYVHEVGHLVTTETDGGAAPVFSEGMAELIGPSGLQQYYLPPPAPETFAYLQRPEFSTPEYYLSAQLLSFLARRYGLAAIRDAYQRARAGATPEQIDDAFVEAFGDDIFDAFDDFQSEPQCPVFLWQCDDEVLPTMELPFSLELDPRSCADAEIPGFTTSKSDHWYPEYLGVLRLSEPRLIRYRIDNAIIVRQECREMCTLDELLPPWMFQTVTEILGITEFTTHTRAGDHHLKVRPKDPQVPFSVEIVDVGPV